MVIVGLHGAAGSGKDTAAGFLTDRGFVQIALADPMKRLAAELWGASEEQLWGESDMRGSQLPGAPDGMTARRALQLIGTEIGRQIDRDVWVRHAVAQARRALRSGPLVYDRRYGFVFGAVDLPPAGVVISDVRYRNELDVIRDAGGTLIKVRRQGAGLLGSDGDHPSEAGLTDDLFDRVIDNNGSLDDLAERIVHAAA